MDIVQNMLTTFNDRYFFKNIITGDESWVCGYDCEIKVQSFQWKPPGEPTQKASEVRLNVNILLTVFFDCNAELYHELLQQGCTANKEYYFEVTRRLCEALCLKRTELWKN